MDPDAEVERPQIAVVHNKLPSHVVE